MCGNRAFSFLFGCLLAILPNLSQAVVMASIKPIQLITAAVADQVTEVELLMPEGSSPHHYSLKPSDRRKLDEAQLLIWSGAELEPFLERLAAQQPSLALSTEEQAGDSDAHHAHDHADEHDQHNHQGEVHFWLAPEEVAKQADRIARRLMELYPEKESQILANLLEFQAALMTLDKENQQRLEPLRDRGFLVFHDAYTGFVEHYGLKQLGYFTVEPDRAPGAKKVAEIRAQIMNSEAACIFREPQFRASVINTVTRGLNVKEGVLDPLASDIPLSKEGYLLFLKEMTDHFVDCLSTE